MRFRSRPASRAGLGFHSLNGISSWPSNAPTGIGHGSSILQTPKLIHNGLDDKSMAGAGWVVRLNVLCKFRLQPDASQPHRRITVVRLAPGVGTKEFRSSSRLDDDLDIWTVTVGHELGHALGMGHIKELMNDSQCIADAQRGIDPDRCYGETEAEKANIMGGGNAFSPLTPSRGSSASKSTPVAPRRNGWSPARERTYREDSAWRLAGRRVASSVLTTGNDACSLSTPALAAPPLPPLTSSCR